MLSTQFVIAQTIVSGKIVNERGEPLPFVHIKLENKSIGTISNGFGLFKLVTNSDNKSVSVVVSTIGYKTKRVDLEKGYHIISLDQDITELTEVVLVPKDQGKQLIQKAIRAIPNNYPIEDEQHTGFFREITTWENQENPIYIAETVIESHKRSYVSAHRSGDVKLIEFRKYESEKLDSLRMRIFAGGHHIHRFDIVSRREAFLRNPDGYKYKIKDTLRQYGKDVYKIYFEKKNKISGHVYVIDSSFAILKANVKQHSFFGVSGKSRQFLEYTVTYQLGEDKVWRFNHSRYNTAFKIRGRLLNLDSRYVTTETQIKKANIPYLEKLQFGDILLNESKEYNPNFWDNYNIILPDEHFESLFKTIDYTNKCNDKKQKFNLISFLSRFKNEVTLNWTSIRTTPYKLTYDNSILDIQQDRVASENNSLGLALTFFYQVKPYFSVGYAGEVKISKTGITAHDLVMAGSFNVNPNRRPIFISPRVNLGYQRLDYFIGNYTAEEDFKIRGKSFDSDKIDLFISQRGFRIEPEISLIVEKSRKLSFLMSVGCNFQLTEKKGMLFHEKEGFLLFRKKAFLENGQQNLLIETNQRGGLKNSISIRAGISYRL
ncbi:carboxypeptidase-like regulatory domain-containing protein [Aquimarina sediminis]|uniref:carboxypeptidase-like regulatory domain-containing protein n=1 Tax=Aquimarina sediminis TaxID=2070536 RepID=UPI0013E8DA17|nr:carboxypeptidase-like regulatory domain-containing protein [Aquimarina sediminis]